LQTINFFMKKAIFTTIIVCFAAAGYSQHLAVNLYGGYTFQDKVSYDGSGLGGYAHADIHGGFMWGVSVEGINRMGSGAELVYQYQGTNIPVYSQNGNNLNPDNNSATISYLLLNGMHYFNQGAKAEPYFGLGLGIGFLTTHPQDGSASASAEKFAWDLKTGVLIHATDKIGIKIGAQLITASIASSTYYYPYYGYVSYYSALYQFGFTGGLVFKFGGH